jgi:two-component system chemotaxis response regulator CheY
MRFKTSISDLRVLMVEPSRMQSHVVEAMLTHLGVPVVECHERGGDALIAMTEHIPSLVISSFYLPDMIGVDLVTAMRADENLESVPFVLISSESRPHLLDPVRQSGACWILPKPFSESQLDRVLAGVVEHISPSDETSNVDFEDLRILLVDDSGVSRRHIRRMLEDLGIEQIMEAENGREAVELLSETMVDLVVTDYNMPEMDGRALIEYIRTHSWQNSVPVLMVTSEQNMDRLAAVERAGVSAICDKPFNAKNIRKLICDAISL